MTFILSKKAHNENYPLILFGLFVSLTEVYLDPDADITGVWRNMHKKTALYIGKHTL